MSLRQCTRKSQLPTQPAHDEISTVKRRLIDVTMSIRRRFNVDITSHWECGSLHYK